jgi:HSP20 family protein
MLVRRVWPSRPTFDSSLADFEQARREVLRLFDAVAGDNQRETGAGVFPPMNISQDDENFYLRAELAGVSADELEISVLQNRVSVAGRREIAREEEGVSYHRKERPEGAFNRSLTLPVAVDSERVEAKYENGILTLTLPKAEAIKPRQIKVRT